MKKIILVDMDNTIVDWDKQFYKFVPFQLDATQRTDWDIYKCWTGMNFHSFINRRRFYETMEPIDSKVIPTLKRLNETHNIFLCTAPPASNHLAMQEKVNWIVKHLGKEWLNRLIVSRDKTVVHGDLLIDDKPEITGVNPNPTWKHIVFERQYNKNTDKPKLNQWDFDTMNHFILNAYI